MVAAATTQALRRSTSRYSRRRASRGAAGSTADPVLLGTYASRSAEPHGFRHGSPRPPRGKIIEPVGRSAKAVRPTRPQSFTQAEPSIVVIAGVDAHSRRYRI